MAGQRPCASFRFDLVASLLSAWFAAGLFLDSWAHNNIPELETFFTPWHAVFYSGFVASAGWLCWPALGRLLAGERGAAVAPVGYGASLVAAPAFAVAGVADFAWHEVFGIEQGLSILFSPTHLVLVITMGVIVTGPVRSRWDRPEGGWRELPLLLSWAFASLLALLFLQYGNALAWSPAAVVAVLSHPSEAPGADDGAVRFLTGVVVTTVVLLSALLLLARRGRVPVGAALLLFAVAALLSGAVTGFGSWVWTVAVLVCGVLVEGLVWWLRPGVGGLRGWLLFGAAVPLVWWSVLMGVTVVSAGLPSVVEYWTGAPVVASAVGLLLAAVVGARPVARVS
ncbi:hypothetical protein [Pilimelia columellifera]|uniref:Uncharacterized protein n=1 Tax=Pilimelia columellifera subsp. columellifera TaxID=706583 RepID=A0ABN3NP74_9ACTN